MALKTTEHNTYIRLLQSVASGIPLGSGMTWTKAKHGCWKMLELMMELTLTLIVFTYYFCEAVILSVTPHSWRMKKNVRGQVVLITGSGNGIGRLLAIRFAQLGCDLVLWDVDENGNNRTAEIVKEYGSRVKSCTIDLSDKSNIQALAQTVLEEFKHVDILINNAGIVTGHNLLQCPDSLVQKTMSVNVMAHFWTIKAFLPTMLERDSGHIVTMASTAGLIGVNRLADYCSSKFALVGLSESLRFELEESGKDGVYSTTVCPFAVKTGMFEGVSSRFSSILPLLEPDDVADRVMQAILTNQQVLLMPRPMYIIIAIRALVPTKCLSVLLRFSGAFNVMDGFKGREGKAL